MKHLTLTLCACITALVSVPALAQNWASRNLTDNNSASNFVNGAYRNCGGFLFFAGGSSTYTYNNEVWVSNGTFSGTFPVSSKNVSAQIAYSPAEFTKVGNSVFFAASDTVHGRELWKCDLTTFATTLVKDIRPTSASSSPHSLAECNGKLLFVCNADASTINGDELWVSDGTNAGTKLLMDVVPGKGASGIDGSITTVSGIAYFDANATTGSGAVPWRSDGTTAGTYQLVNPGTSFAYPGAFTSYGGSTYFFMRTGNSSGEYSLWKSTGTSAVLIKERVARRLPDVVVIANNRMFFRGYDSTSGEEVWKSDGTAAGTVRVTEVGPGSASGLDSYPGAPSEIVALGTKIYFVGNDGSAGKQLWRSDGTAAGTQMVQLISNLAGSKKPDPDGLIVFNNNLFFRMVRDGYGLEWFTSNGTTISAAPAVDIWPGTSDGIDRYQGEQIVIGNSLFFVGRDPSVRQELWRIGPPLTITTQPQSRILAKGSNATFSVTGTSASPISYTWKKNGILITSATSASYAISGLALTDAGNYEAQLDSEDGTAGSAIAKLAVVDTAVAPSSVAAGGTIKLQVSASSPSGATLTYQWKRGTTSLADSPTPSTGLITGAKGATLTITKASANEVGSYTCIVGIQSTSLSLTTQAAAVAVVAPPVVATNPAHKVVTEGIAVMFTAAATNATGVTYKWYYNGAVITGATVASYSIASATLAHGGAYHCEMTNAAGTVLTNRANLTVVKAAPSVINVADAGSVKMSVTVTTSSLAKVAYTWRLNGVAIPNGVQVSGASIIGVSTSAITITNIKSAEAGTWTCAVTADSITVSPTVGTVNVKYRPVVTTVSAPTAIISGPLSWQLGASNSPTSYAVTGLPSGLSCGQTTGLISGTPVVAGVFTVRVTAANDVGMGATQSIPLIVATLPSTQTGTWTAAIPRHRALNGNLGGKVTVVITPTGTYTGSVANGVTPISISGRVIASVSGNPTISQRIVRPGLLDLWLNATLNATTNVLSGTVTDGTDNATVIGGKQTFGSANLASSYAALYNTTADIRSVYSADSYPHGRGFAQITVTSLGLVSGSGRTGDGTAYTLSSALWFDGRFPMFILLYNGRGSMTGIPQVSLGATSATADDRLTATFSWFKMSALLSTERSYASGFDIPDTVWGGSRWTAVARGQLPLGWVIKGGNARIILSSGGIATAAQVVAVTQKYALGTNGVGTFDRVVNPCGITSSVNLATGVCTGGFTLIDPASPTAFTRKATYTGLMIPHLNNVAYGWFSLPQLPQSGQTLLTSPILAGRVDITPQ